MTWALLICNLASIACVISAAVLAFHGISGWGWFLFLALLLCSSLTTND
jgi:hypothetical protein